MILDSVYPSTGGGGAESQVGTLTRWLAEQGIPSTIVVPMVPWGPQVAHERQGLVESSGCAIRAFRCSGGWSCSTG